MRLCGSSRTTVWPPDAGGGAGLTKARTLSQCSGVGSNHWCVSSRRSRPLAEKDPQGTRPSLGLERLIGELLPEVTRETRGGDTKALFGAHVLVDLPPLFDFSMSAMRFVWALITAWVRGESVSSVNHPGPMRPSRPQTAVPPPGQSADPVLVDTIRRRS